MNIDTDRLPSEYWGIFVVESRRGGRVNECKGLWRRWKRHGARTEDELDVLTIDAEKLWGGCSHVVIQLPIMQAQCISTRQQYCGERWVETHPLCHHQRHLYSEGCTGNCTAQFSGVHVPSKGSPNQVRCV